MADLTAAEAAKLDRLRGKARNLTLGTRLRNLEVMTDPTAAGQFKVFATVAVAVGDLVSVTGYNSANTCYSVHIADCDNKRFADGMALAAISASAVGYVSRVGYVTGLDTSLNTLGDTVYLTATGTTGNTTSTTAPTGSDDILQIVGHVAEVHATTGRFFVSLGTELVAHDHADAGGGGAISTTSITNLDIGASGTAGTLDVFPTTALKGKIAITAADSAGDTTTSIVNASQAAARAYTIPDAGADASFAMTQGAQTLAGVQTYTLPRVADHNTTITAFATGGQASATALTGEWNNVTTCATAADSVKLPAAVAGQVISIKNSGAASLAVFPATADAINALAVNLSVDIPVSAELTFRAIDATTWETCERLTLPAATTQTGNLVIQAAASAGNTDTTITNASQAAARTYSIPDAGANADFVMSAGAQTLTSKTLTSPTINTPSITGGTAIELTGLSVRSTGAAQDLLFASSEALTADRTLSFNLSDGNKTLQLAGNLTTSGANALTLTTTGATNVTLPTTGTLGTLAGVETLTNKTLTTPTINSATMATPALGTPASGVMTNVTGTAAGLTAGTVTTNANLTGPITSAGNATSVAAQTGTGTTFVMQATPTLTTPVIGVATGTSLAATGAITSSGSTAGIGYATGAGGAVTQVTSRSTGVTLNTITGTITTHNASLAAEGTVDFTVTNSAVAIGDTVVVSMRSGSNGGGTVVTVSAVAAGTFDIRTHNGNVAAGTAETGAILINFAVIKAVSA